MDALTTNRILTFAEALDLLRNAVSERTLRSAYRTGDLRAFQPVRNGKVLIRESDLVAWIESRHASTETGAQ